MKNTLFTCLLSIISICSFAQSIKKEYYDYRKTQLMAEYQVNSVGEKHGWFKGYDQQGILVYEYNYKNNLWDGVNKEYSTYTGSRTLSQSETYKAGVLNGPAIYYAGDGSYKGRFVKAQGSHKDGERDGDWVLMESFDSYGWSDDIKKAAQYTKGTFRYIDGEIVYPDGEFKAYYYPSEKTYFIGSYLNGKMVGDHIQYNPDGTIKTQQHFDTAEEIALKKQNELKIIDSALVAIEKEEFTKAEAFFKSIKYNDASNAMNYLVKAKKFSEEKNYKASIENITHAYSGYSDQTEPPIPRESEQGKLNSFFV